MIQSYLVHFTATALDCDFTCPSWEHALSDIYIKDQLISGIANDALQADLQAEAGTLKSLDQNVCYAEAFESALQNQNSEVSISDIAMARMSTYRGQKNNAPQVNTGDVRTST